MTCELAFTSIAHPKAMIIKFVIRCRLSSRRSSSLPKTVRKMIRCLNYYSDVRWLLRRRRRRRLKVLNDSSNRSTSGSNVSSVQLQSTLAHLTPIGEGNTRKNRFRRIGLVLRNANHRFIGPIDQCSSEWQHPIVGIDHGDCATSHDFGKAI